MATDGAEFWAALHFVAVCGLPVRQRPTLPGGMNSSLEFKIPRGTHDSVLALVDTMDMPDNKFPALITDEDVKRRDDLIISVFTAEFAKGGVGDMPAWNLFWAALQMAQRNNIPLRLKSESDKQWRLGICCGSTADYDVKLNMCVSHRRGVPRDAEREVVQIANMLDIDNTVFPLGPDSSTDSFDETRWSGMAADSIVTPMYPRSLDRAPTLSRPFIGFSDTAYVAVADGDELTVHIPSTPLPSWLVGIPSQI